MKIKECFGRILASDLTQHYGAAGVCVLEVGDIIDLVIDD
jgi:hypothetical protein